LPTTAARCLLLQVALPADVLAALGDLMALIQLMISLTAAGGTAVPFGPSTPSASPSLPGSSPAPGSSPGLSPEPGTSPGLAPTPSPAGPGGYGGMPPPTYGGAPTPSPSTEFVTCSNAAYK
jgi:hypothetical protein